MQSRTSSRLFTCNLTCLRCATKISRQPKSVTTLTCKHTSGGQRSDIQAVVTAKHAMAMAAAGAVLGPLCDGQHSQHMVLEYSRPVLIRVEALDWQLQTCWWVPVLFGLAAVILGLSHPYLDQLAVKHKQVLPACGLHPSWPAVLVGISTFVLQYAASGSLEFPLLGQNVGPVPSLDVLLCTTGVLQWYTFDHSPQGFFMAALTALAGPVIEIIIIKQFGLYHYNHPGPLGIPTWIPWVYFCGAPAVGNLGRKVKIDLLQQSQTTCVAEDV